MTTDYLKQLLVVGVYNYGRKIMPYIEGSDRVDVDVAIHSLLDYMEWCGCTPGILNYIITKIAIKYINTHGKKYATINDVIGVLNAATHELYRRVAANYEDEKIK